ncbi:type I restriction endonuclease subunit S [Trinickia dabaoshanensis]|uniref:Type I restriction endonuclease subunit S n=1 Tax=Trinickia dabaoshanensis TaxID=564714 RepID=A0A2N7VEI5_9BURK|nr:restriction endonuclease subunit S [Trinickia dabaoshanensis]PMS15557.1 type I restriction endonuclease subunit S [Trinickia dabaoshanensis]
MNLRDGFEMLATAPHGITRLRELILSLAVQGRLTDRNALDEPPSRLVDRINSERDLLVEAGRLKRGGLPSQVSDEDKPFSLPDGWQWTRLGSLALQITDGTHHTPKYLSAGVPFISVKDLDGRTVNFNNCKFISEDEHALINRRCNPERGDVLICRIGTLGRPTIVDTDISFSVFVSVGLIKLPKSVDISTFLHLALRSPVLTDQYERIKAGGSHTVKLNLGDIPQLLIPLPPIEEQARIVAKVDELMRLCDELETRGRLEAEQHAQLTTTLFDALAASESSHALAENWTRVAAHFDLLLDRPEAVDALERIIMHLAVRGLLVPQDPTDDAVDSLLEQVRTRKEELVAEGKAKREKPMPAIEEQETPFALPAGWKWIRLGQLLSKLGAGSTPLGGKDVYVASGVKFLRSQNVWNEGLHLEGVAFITPETHARMAGTVVLPDDILFNITGASIGRCAVVPGEFDEANVSQHVAIVRPLVNDITSYLHLVLISPHVQQTVMDVQVGVSREGLSMSKLSQFVIPLPPLAEQSRIVARVEELRRLCADLRERLTARQRCQARFSEALVEQATLTVPLMEDTDGLAAAA